MINFPSAPTTNQLHTENGVTWQYDGTSWVVVQQNAAAVAVPLAACGRLSLESGVPISTTDQTSKTTVYWVPWRGNQISLYDGSLWNTIASAQVSLALGTLTSGKAYDVFGYLSAGAMVLEFSAAWASDTTRTDALTTQDGIYVKSGATTRRYLGTIYTTSTTTTEDSEQKRFLYNEYNQVERRCVGPLESTDSWTYSVATYRQARATATNQFEYVSGMAHTFLDAEVIAGCSNSSAGPGAAVGIGINSTTVNSARAYGNGTSNTFGLWQTAKYRGYPGLGKNTIAWLEAGTGSGTTTFYGDAGVPTVLQSAISGVVRL